MTDGEPDPRQAAVRSIGRHGFHNIAYLDWGDPAASEIVFCVHGLSRNSHDFDPLARVLAARRRVICPDLAGRGRSDWLEDPSDYHLLQYNLDLTVLAARIGAEGFDWIGTSLGGLMGIVLAGVPNSPIRRLVINDTAPEIPAQALRRLALYLGEDRRFPDLQALEAHLRETLAPFGPMTDADWRRMAETSSTPTDQGYRLAYDPGIAQNFRRYWLLIHTNLWRYWDRISCPVLILRGTRSDFLTPPLLDRMRSRLPHAEVIEFDGVGHTPTLNAPEQIDPVLQWLDAREPAPDDATAQSRSPKRAREKPLGSKPGEPAPEARQNARSAYPR